MIKITKRSHGDNPKIENYVKDYNELINIDWIKNIWIDYGYSIAYSPIELYDDNICHLMSVKNKSYMVIGFIHGDGKDLGLMDYNDLIKL